MFQSPNKINSFFITKTSNEKNLKKSTKKKYRNILKAIDLFKLLPAITLDTMQIIFNLLKEIHRRNISLSQQVMCVFARHQTSFL